MTIMVRVLVFKPTYVGYTFQQQQNSRQSANQSVTVWSPSETTMNKKKKKRNIELKNFDGVLFSRSKSQEEEKLGREICETTVCRLNMEPTTFEIIIIQFGLKMPCFSWSFLGAFYSSPKSNCCSY